MSISRRTAVQWLSVGAAMRFGGIGGLAASEQAAVKVVMALPPGGASSALMQSLLGPLQARLGAPIELDYQPGAGGNVAAMQVVRAAPDGRTLLLSHPGPLAINHHIMVQSAFDPQQDLAPLALLAQFPIVISVAAKYGVASLPSLVSFGRRKRLILGSSGNGSIQHLAGELFCRFTGLEVVQVPFAGGGALQQAFERGALDLLLETGPNVIRHLNAGRLRALAVMAVERLAALPDVPTLAEAGMPGLEVSTWFGLLAPAATPDALRASIAKAVLEALASAEVRTALISIGGNPLPLPEDGFKRFIAAENARWGKLIREAGLSRLGAASGGAIGTPQ